MYIPRICIYMCRQKYLETRFGYLNIFTNLCECEKKINTNFSNQLKTDTQQLKEQQQHITYH